MKRIVAMTTLSLLLVGCTGIEDHEKKVDNTIENGGAYPKELSKEDVDTQENEDSITLEGEDPNTLETDDSNVLETELKDTDEYKFNEDLKILSTYKLNIETTSFENTLNLISGKTHLLGGYVESNHKENNYSGKTSKLSLRIPKGKMHEMEEFLRKNENIRITEEVLDSIDVSERALDVDSRLKNVEEREKRLLQMYESAQNVEEILLVEEKLFSVIEEKEKLKAKKSTLKDRFSFARIDIDLKEVKKFPKEDGDESEISKAFSSSFTIIGKAFSDLVILFAKLLPLLALLLSSSIFFVPFFIKKYKEKKSRENEYNNEKDEDSENLTEESFIEDEVSEETEDSKEKSSE